MIALVLMLAAADPAIDTSRLAVMPFKNLNADPQLDWLRLGVAETMINDLRGARKNVVERDQLDKALAELALQKTNGNEESTAAAAGKLVGATHVVVGGFQRAGQQVRITARLVTVETGVVDGSAKVTGDLTGIFALQDSVVTQLLKLPAPKRNKPANPQKTLAAYKAYAQSLQDASDVDRIEHLRSALDLDPDFHYALYDMRALESRLDRYQKKARVIVDEKTEKALAIVGDAKATPQDRNMQAMQAMTMLMQQYRYQAMLDVATDVANMDIPAPTPPMVSAKEVAGFFIFTALVQLKRTDLALQYGEQFIARYPGSMYVQGVDIQMRAIIDQAHRHEKTLKDGERDIAAFELEQRNRKKEPTAIDARNDSFRACTLRMWAEKWAEAVEVCKTFADDYKAADDADDKVKWAHFDLMRAWSELGRFDEARDESKRILDAWPDWAHTNSVDMIAKFYPQP